MESPQKPKLLLPPPPHEMPPNVVPVKIRLPGECSSVLESIKPRAGPLNSPFPGSKGKIVSLLTNHLQVSIASAIGDFYHYDISLSYEDGCEVTSKTTKIAVIEKLCDVYKSELDGKALVYDGVRSLFTPGPLPQNNLEFKVVLNSVSAKGLSEDESLSWNDQKRQRLASRSKIFKVQMKFVSQISMQSLKDPNCGGKLMDSRCLRILDTILQQQALKRFSLKLGEARTIETTVYDYFVSTRGIELSFSANLPCINVGKPHRPTFFPVELCYLLPLQRYRNELNVYQRSAIIRKSSQKPEDLIKDLSDDVKRIKHETEPLLQSCGISINSFVQVEGRVLSAPRLKMGNGEHIIPRNAWWNIKDKKLVESKRLESWAVVNFSTQCDVRNMCGNLAKLGSTKGMVINPPLYVFEENPKLRKKPPSFRVEMMFQQVKSKFHQEPPQFILCLLADKKFSDLYGPWKRKTIIELGILDQCISSSKLDEVYLMNLLLKINVKLGGINHTVVSELTRSIPFISKIPTMIFGIHVSHAGPGRADAPSIASVVGSREWPRISSYRASLRAIPPKAQMIDSLFKPMSQQEDAGIIGELLLEFHSSSGQKKPAQIIIFRHGLSTSEFKQVLHAEMDQILKACNFLEKKWRPKFTVIVAQRRHHTKFFDAKSGANILPGTVVDNKVCDLQLNNFYMSTHAARIGTSRPTHYHVLLDEIGFSSDDLQELIHSLSYVFQRSNNVISEVAPIRYARLAAAKIAQVIKPDKMLKGNTSESKGGYRLPKLHENVSSSMFFI